MCQNEELHIITCAGSCGWFVMDSRCATSKLVFYNNLKGGGGGGEGYFRKLKQHSLLHDTHLNVNFHVCAC